MLTDCLSVCHRLRYSQRGFLMIDGFSELSDAINDDIDPWLPNIPVMEPKIDIDTAKYIVARVGDKFCELVQQERESKSLAGDEGKSNVNKVVLRHYKVTKPYTTISQTRVLSSFSRLQFAVISFVSFQPKLRGSEQ